MVYERLKNCWCREFSPYTFEKNKICTTVVGAVVVGAAMLQ